MIDVTCVGIQVADVIAKPVDQVPAKGRLGQVEAIGLYAGGNAATAARCAARLGLRTAVIGKVGADPFGEFLTRTLQAEGVDCTGLVVDTHVQTSVSVVLSSADGERTFLHCVGADGTFRLADVDWGVVADSRIVFVTGTFLLDAFDGPETAAFLQRCRELGKVTALDTCWDSQGRWATLLDPVLPWVDLFLPSSDEARELTGADDPAVMADRLLAAGCRTVVIKLGAGGCYVRPDADTPGYTVPACAVGTVVDTTGAGDSFCAGFLAGWVRGLGLEDCARLANAAGALSVTSPGAGTGITDYATTAAYMERQYG